MTENLQRLFPTMAETYPESDSSDYAVTLARSVISVLPVAGGPINEMIASIFGTPVENRRDEWLKHLADVVEELQRNTAELTPEKLSSHPVFISAAIQASRIAIGTHQQEKLTYLRNALLKIGMSPASDGTKEQIFLSTIEAFTPAHVKALDLMWRPNLAQVDWNNRNIPLGRRSYVAAIGIVAPEIDGQTDLIKHVVRDLFNRRFSSIAEPEIEYPQAGLITNLGIDFLAYVLRPTQSPK